MAASALPDGFGIVAPTLSPAPEQRLRASSGMILFVLSSLMWNDNPLADAFWRATFDAADTIGFPLWLVFEGMVQFRG